MGAWGTSISSNDSFQDVYQDFFELYNEGLEVKEITEKLITNYPEFIESNEDSNNFWFAIAKAQWECKNLDTQIFQKVKLIIDSESDISVWKELGASDKDLNKRKVVLEKFLETLKSEKNKPKARKKKIIRQPFFEKGNCIAIKLANDFFGGIVVLEAVKDTELGMNLIAVTRIYQKDKPTLSDFEKSNVLNLSFPNWQNHLEIAWCYRIAFNKLTVAFENIGNIKVEYDFPHDNYSSGFYYNGTLEKFKNDIERQMEFELKNSKSDSKTTIKSLTKKNKWKLW